MARIVVPPVLLTASLVTHHIITTSVQATLISATFTNHDSVKRTVGLHFVPSGGSAANANQIIGLQAGENELEPGEMRHYEWVHFLAAGDFIQALASVAAVVAMRLSVLEEAP